MNLTNTVLAMIICGLLIYLINSFAPVLLTYLGAWYLGGLVGAATRKYLND